MMLTPPSYLRLTGKKEEDSTFFASVDGLVYNLVSRWEVCKKDKLDPPHKEGFFDNMKDQAPIQMPEQPEDKSILNRRMSRREAIKSMGVAAGSLVASQILQACTPFIVQEPKPGIPPATEENQPTSQPEAEKPLYEVLDRQTVFDRTATNDVPVEKIYEELVRVYKSKPELKAERSEFDLFAIQINPKDSNQSLMYSFLTVTATEPDAKTFVAMIFQNPDNPANIGASPLQPAEFEQFGQKHGLLRIEYDPFTGGRVEPINVFEIPMPWQAWEQLTPEQRNTQAVRFYPTGVNIDEPIQVPGVLAKLSRYSVVTPTSTPEAMATNEPEPAQGLPRSEVNVEYGGVGVKFSFQVEPGLKGTYAFSSFGINPAFDKLYDEYSLTPEERWAKYWLFGCHRAWMRDTGRSEVSLDDYLAMAASGEGNTKFKIGGWDLRQEGDLPTILDVSPDEPVNVVIAKSTRYNGINLPLSYDTHKAGFMRDKNGVFTMVVSGDFLVADENKHYSLSLTNAVKAQIEAMFQLKPEQLAKNIPPSAYGVHVWDKEVLKLLWSRNPEIDADRSDKITAFGILKGDTMADTR